MGQYKVDSLNAVQNFEVYVMTDKAKRDDMYRQFRESTDPQERQAVKFSGCEIVLDKDGEEAYTVSGYTQEEFDKAVANLTPKLVSDLKKRLRPVYRSTWSVAYPSGRG